MNIPSAADILIATIETTGSNQGELYGKSRMAVAVQARTLAVAAARDCTKMSYPEIARMLGRCHGSHATAWGAMRRYESRSTQHERDLCRRIVIRARGLAAQRTAAKGTR